ADPDFLNAIDAIRKPGIQLSSDISVPENSSPPTQMPATELYPFGDPNNPTMPQIPNAPKLPEFPQEALPNELEFDPFEEIEPETEPAITRVAQPAEPYVEPTPSLASPQAPEPTPVEFEVEPVTNRLPTPEGSNGPVTLRSPQGPVPTPEPTPNVTVT